MNNVKLEPLNKENAFIHLAAPFQPRYTNALKITLDHVSQKIRYFFYHATMSERKNLRIVVANLFSKFIKHCFVKIAA